MLSKTNQKKIYSKLNNIYQSHCNKEDVNFYTSEVVQLLNQFNQKNKKKIKNITEKTSMLICYGDSIFSQNQKHSIKVFKNFFQKRIIFLFLFLILQENLDLMKLTLKIIFLLLIKNLKD